MAKTDYDYSVIKIIKKLTSKLIFILEKTQCFYTIITIGGATIPNNALLISLIALCASTIA